MKTINVVWVLVLSLLLTPAIVRANVVGGVDPSYVKVKVYEIRLFQSADCSGGGLTIYRNNAPSLTDMSNSPTIGAGAIPNGTYNCVGLKMSDNIHFATPADTLHLGCHGGDDHISDVGHDDIAIDPDGTSHVLGTQGTEDIVWLYIRTGGGNTNGGNQHTWQPTSGIPLTAPLVVTGDQSRTMVFDFSGRVGDESDGLGGWQCGCDSPTMSFR